MRPLDGIRILDLTHALAGPVCTFQLGLLGAEIIKIENPRGGDDFRGFAKPVFDAVNGGKLSVALDLKSAGAIEVLQRIAAECDVIVDNFKPGTAERYGLTEEAVTRWSDRLIWCSISGFGLEGPWRDHPAVEWSVQAASGLSASYLGEADDPRDLGLGILDVATGHAAATAVLAAIIQRSRTGKGSRIDVAMLDVALAMMAPRVGSGSAGRMPRRPAVGRFAARDGQVFIMGAHQRWFETISSVLGEPPLVEDPRFATPESRDANAADLRIALEQRLAGKTASEWADVLTAAGVPAAPVRTLADVVSSDHVATRGGLLRQQITGSEQSFIASGLPYQIVGSPSASGIVPGLGEHTEEVLARAGLDFPEIEALRESGVVGVR